MKKFRVIIAIVLFCAVGYIGYTTYERMTMTEAEKFMLANLEALTNDGETGSVIGRLRTVGCGGPRFDQWKIYCCPADTFWNNCNGNKGNCRESKILGCYDPPRHLEIVINRFM